LSHHVAQLGALTEGHQTATDTEISALLDSVRSLLMPSEGMILTTQVHAASETEGPPWGHLKFSGVVTKKAGALAVKAPDGSTYQLNPNASQRHGHEFFKEGHEVTVLLNENNAVIDVHPKGQEVNAS
jgi:hypothetical protein